MLVAFVSARHYYASRGDSASLRALVGETLKYLPFWILTWIVGVIVTGNSITRARRVTWHGLGALVLLAVPAIPIAILVVVLFWRFLAGPP
ncbi:hypothetical protein [Schlesneria paludicola]|uniref:hypothetical protein n=1 Tax=Schlesneria paludicola TaxID=360056 RepID=UPI00029AFA5C|nr:hypothetical protein [Schlesneria paludicola]